MREQNPLATEYCVEETRMRLKQTFKMIFTAFAIFSFGAPGISAAQSGDDHYIVIVGAPKAGKSRNSEWMSKAYDIPWIDVGAALQAEVEKESKKNRYSASTQHKRGAASAQRSKKNREAFEKLQKGELVSNDALNAIIASKVLSSEASAGFILDGYPMTVEQAEFLDSILEARGISPLKVLYLNISDEESRKRMKASGKAKYKGGVGEERLRIFRSMISPIIDYYGEHAVFDIDAAQDNSAISAEIVSKLGSAKLGSE
jgi:adenylate kinase